MRKNPLIIFCFLFSNLILASDFAQKMEDTYKRQQSHIEIFCTAPDLKLIETVRLNPNEITSIHELDGQIFSISLNTDSEIFLKNEQGILIHAKKTSRNLIEFEEPEDKGVNDAFYQKYRLYTWICRTGTYFDKPIVIDERKTHIVVHPHPFYDEQNLASPYIENLLQLSNIRHIMLLDNFSKNVSADISEFIRGIEKDNKRNGLFQAPNILIPEEVELYGASAGWSHFKFETEEANITYSGGNLNYCIHNSTNFLIDGFLQYNKKGNLSLNYDLNGMLAQKDGLIGPDFIAGSIFDRQYRGFFVKDYFNENPDDEEEFHEDWFEYLIKKKFAYRRYFYKTIHLTYRYKNKIFQETISGLGEGEFNISLNIK